MAGIGTRSLVITIGGTDYTAEVSNARIVSGESDADFVTFASAATGGSREYRLEFTAVQDAASASLWRQVWDNAGDTVAFLLKPYGNAAASVGQPHFSGNATITEPDGDLLGGEANASTTARFTFDASWVCDAKPTLVTT
jgi:hypothetical protein